MKKTLVLASSSLCLLASTAALAATTTQSNSAHHRSAHKTQKQQVQHSATKKSVEKPVLNLTPVESHVKHPTMKNPGPMHHLASLIGMGPRKRIEINGFLSAGVSGTNATPKSTFAIDAANRGSSVNYDRGYVIPERGVIENKVGFASNTEVGLQFTGNITSTLSAVAQFVANGSEIDGSDSFAVETQWAFVRYRPNNQWQVRAGRMRIPLFAYSDTQEIGYTYPWVFLPNSVYRIVPFNNFNGADVVFSQPLGSGGWLLRIHPFYGSNRSTFDTFTQGFVDAGGTGTCDTSSSPATNCGPAFLKFKEHGILGGELSIGNDQVQLRGSYAHASLDAFAKSNAATTLETLTGDQAYFYSVGLKLAFDWFHMQGEYASRHADKAKAGEGSIANLDGYYAMVGGQFGRWFPNVTYGNLRTTNKGTLRANNYATFNTNEAAQAEDEWTVGLDYTVNGNIVVKVSATRIKPKDGTWGLYNYDTGTKATYMYAASVDTIF